VVHFFSEWTWCEYITHCSTKLQEKLHSLSLSCSYLVSLLLKHTDILWIFQDFLGLASGSWRLLQGTFGDTTNDSVCLSVSHLCISKVTQNDVDGCGLSFQGLLIGCGFDGPRIIILDSPCASYVHSLPRQVCA